MRRSRENPVPQHRSKTLLRGARKPHAHSGTTRRGKLAKFMEAVAKASSQHNELPTIGGFHIN